MKRAVSALARLGSLFALSLCVSRPAPAAAEQPREQAEPASAAPAPRVSGLRRAAAVSTALVPGAVLHGAGHWALGDPVAARRLMAMQGVGLGLIALGGGSLALTGASRYLVAAEIATAAAGFGLFAVSWFADIYGTSNRDPGAVRYAAPPFIQTQLGYRFVQDSQFDYRHFWVEQFDLYSAGLRLSPSAWLSPQGQNGRYGLDIAYRFIGPRPGEQRPLGSRVDFELGTAYQRFAPEQFDTTTFTAALSGRYDLGRIGYSMSGAFADWQIGAGLLRYAYGPKRAQIPSDLETFLLARFGVGALLRGPAARGSEVSVYYDHRHDDLAAGLKITGIGSGAIGHFGIDARYFLDENWGVLLDARVGAARVLGASLLFREPLRRRGGS